MRRDGGHGRYARDVAGRATLESMMVTVRRRRVEPGNAHFGHGGRAHGVRGGYSPLQPIDPTMTCPTRRSREPSRSMPGRCALRLAAGLLATSLAAFGSAAPARERAETGVEAVAAELANPLAPVTSASVQYRTELRVGPGDATHHALRVQPSFFVPRPDGAAFLLRTILPLRSVSWPSGARGLGDLTLVPYYVPDTTASTFVGWGAAINLPTATDDALGAGKWSAGPAVLFARTGQPVTWGGLAQHVRSFAGDDARARVNVTTVQPFATRLLGDGWSAGVNVEATYNWELPSGSRWTVPVAVAVSRVVPLWGSYVNLGAAAVGYVERPSFAPSAELRLSAQYVIR
ncbi:MAG: hypothetical protein O9972_49820 [Burkholderiales bacterium]|nr:hypothetical protein [Burkholderiales bacterium]